MAIIIGLRLLSVLKGYLVEFWCCDLVTDCTADIMSKGPQYKRIEMSEEGIEDQTKEQREEVNVAGNENYCSFLILHLIQAGPKTNCVSESLTRNYAQLSEKVRP